MSREVRKVPKDWIHPGNKPLYKNSKGEFRKHLSEWEQLKSEWEKGQFPSYASEESKKITFEEYYGKKPNPDGYMPEFNPEECTHFQMYETVSEGSPISPVCASIEELAHWLSDNKASACGNMTASYEQWLSMCKMGSCPSMALINGSLMSGVTFTSEMNKGE